MYLPTWLRLARRRLFGPVPSAARRRKARKAARVRPRLEALEARLAPASFQTLYNFTNGNDGKYPVGGVAVDSSDNLYGTTEFGGVGGGTLFELINGKFTTLNSFTNASGTMPWSAPIRDSHGNLFGTTFDEGSGGQGVVYEYSADGQYTILHNFIGSDGASPEATPFMDNKGNLYGSTFGGGGPNFSGTVWELSPNGSGGYSFRDLHTFGLSDGINLMSGEIVDSKGNVYGTTTQGGAYGNGTVFEIAPDGTFTILHSFSGNGDGKAPVGGLVMDSQGDIFGTTNGYTYGSGSDSAGTVFEISAEGTYSVLYDFTGGNDGTTPYGTLLLDAKGNLYGTTYGNGTLTPGTLFELSPTGSGGYNLTTLHSFDVSDGSNPYAGLTVDSNGNLYGTTENGGTDGFGTIFELSGVFSVGPTTTTAANNATAVFSTNTQNVNLTADVTSSGGPVNEGTVTFTVMQGSTVIGSATTSNTVNNGAASVSYALPANLAAGTYSIDAVYSGEPDFQGSSDNSHTLTITPAQVTTSTGSVTTFYSPNQQTLGLNARVTDQSNSSSTVDEGAITFTVMDGSKVVGSGQGTVSSGTAKANVTLPAGQAVGSYTIDVTYSDSQGNFSDSGDSNGTLTIGAANVAATAQNVSTIYTLSSQTVALKAIVKDESISSDTVDEGTVTFTVMNGNAALGSVSGTVSGGTASANFTLPAGQAIGDYTIAVSYSDSTGNFSDDGDTSGTLAVGSSNVTTTANNLSAFYSPNAQTVTLTANVADASIPSDTVGEGTVTFTVMNGNAALGSVSGTVSGGTASANFTLPAGQAVGSYIIDVSYNDTSGNFTDSGDQSATLTVGPAPVTTTANIVAAVYSTNTQTLALSAGVADASIPTDTVDEGTVTFTVLNGSTSLGSIAGTVSDGTANANFTLPAGQTAGSYTITTQYSDSQGLFADGGDSNGTLTVTPANVSTTANTASAFYSPNAQTLALSANVADTSVPGDIVNEGAVTFTIRNGSTIIGSGQGTVSSGTANASITLPAGLAPGSYTVAVQYSDSPGNFTDGGDTQGAFTVAPARVTTTAVKASTLYSPTTQTVTLNAVLADASVPGDTANEGTVTFTVANGGTTLGSIQGTVSGGNASANFTLPAGLAVGSYTLAVHYSDGQGNFSDGGDQSAVLTVSPANATTTASSASTRFSSTAQTVKLRAAVDDPGEPAALTAGLIGEGIVTFTLLDGNTVVGSAAGAVNGGTANAALTLPGGLAAGNYTLAAGYSDGQGNFRGGSNSYTTLTISPAATNAQLTQITLTPMLLSLTTTETLTAHVSSSTPIMQGTVTFFVSNYAITTNVDGNGNATVVVPMPMLALLGPQDVSVQYNNAADNRTASSDSQTAGWHILNPIAPSTATFTPTSDSVTADFFGLFIAYTNGVLTEIDYGSMHLVFRYNAAGQLAQVTFDGMNLL